MNGWFRHAAAGGRAWVDFWNEREAQTSLWVCRVLVSVVVLADLLQALWLGLVPDAWAAPPNGLGWGATGDSPPWLVSVLGASTTVVWGAWGLALLTSLTFAFGLATRVSGILLALTLAELSRFAPEGNRGVDVLLRTALPILALSGSHARWSLDAWARRRLGKAPLSQNTAWPRYLLFAQLVWMYNSAAQNRYDSAWWPSGHFSALGTLLCDPHYARFDDGWVKAAYPLTQVATATTMLFETTSPLLLLWTWLDRTPERGGALGRVVRAYKVRWAWLTFGVFLHLGIALTMRLGIFSFGVLSLYPAFVHPDELAALRGRLRARSGRGGVTSPE